MCTHCLLAATHCSQPKRALTCRLTSARVLRVRQPRQLTSEGVLRSYAREPPLVARLVVEAAAVDAAEEAEEPEEPEKAA